MAYCKYANSDCKEEVPSPSSLASKPPQSPDKCLGEMMKSKSNEPNSKSKPPIKTIIDKHEDHWCSTDGLDDDYPKKETLDFDVILSAKPWRKDIVPKYQTLKEEILSHEVIGQRTWMRIKIECEKAMKVQYI